MSLDMKRKRAPRPHTSSEKRKLSIAEKVARLEQLELFKDWILEPRQRPTGIYDFVSYTSPLLNNSIPLMQKAIFFHIYLRIIFMVALLNFKIILNLFHKL